MTLEDHEIQQHLKDVQANITNACQRVNRSPQSVRVLLATKTVSPEHIRLAAKMGYTLVGENTAQELKTKKPLLADTSLDWHFIGHLQTNKVKEVVEHCSTLHSLDRPSLAQEIEKRAAASGKTIKVFVEINSSREEAKSGVLPEHALEFCKSISALNHIEVIGLMTVAVDSTDEMKVRECFRTTRNLFNGIKEKNFKNFKMTDLSMGMSADYLLAIEEGATLLRLGSIIFGKRLLKA